MILLLKNIQAVRSPVTFTMVLVISRILSTPNSRTTPTAGTPAAISIVDQITILVPGADGAPIDAASEVNAIKIIVVKLRFTSKS